MAERFTTTIEVQGKTATCFTVPLDVRAVFGRARQPVRVTIGGHTRPTPSRAPSRCRRELRAALDADRKARATFEALSFTHRREYAEWVAEAKRDDTKLCRAAKAVENLRGGKTL